MVRKIEPVTLKDVRIVFRNFAGQATQYNRKGDRNFGVLLDHDMASALIEMGWNVKELPAREEGDLPQPWLKVKVNFDSGRPPQVTLLTSRNRVNLDEDTVAQVDLANIARTDMIISPYEWSVDGKTGVTAYLQKIFITLNEDELDLMYNDRYDMALDPHDD